MSVLFFFIDGIGAGDRDAEKNPFARFPTPYFPIFQDEAEPVQLPHDGLLGFADATMDMPGLPQSATGQTALLTGVNTAKAIGRHLSGFPTVSLREILAEESIFLKLEAMGLNATFANAFTPEYFERQQRHVSATTWSVKASGFPFRMIEPDLWQAHALSHDLSNEFLSELGYDVPIRTPEKAAEILANITQSVDFCLFEYFLTDMIGHKQDMARAQKELDRLTRFLEVLLRNTTLPETTVLVTSDHGNFEDLSVGSHTRNPVPVLAWGKHRQELIRGIRRIEDVTATILDCLRR